MKKWTVPYGSASWRQSLDRRIITASDPNSDQVESIARNGASLPDGFVCANDEIALALMQLLQSRDIEVPARCRVVGIDNTAASLEASVPLTTVDLAKEWLGMRAVESFMRKRIRPEAQHRRSRYQHGSLLGHLDNVNKIQPDNLRIRKSPHMMNKSLQQAERSCCLNAPYEISPVTCPSALCSSCCPASRRHVLNEQYG